MRRLFTVLPKPKHTRSVVLVLTCVYAYTGACDNGSRNFPQATLTDFSSGVCEIKYHFQSTRMSSRHPFPLSVKVGN